MCLVPLQSFMENKNLLRKQHLQLSGRWEIMRGLLSSHPPHRLRASLVNTYWYGRQQIVPQVKVSQHQLSSQRLQTPLRSRYSLQLQMATVKKCLKNPASNQRQLQSQKFQCILPQQILCSLLGKHCRQNINQVSNVLSMKKNST